jgi:hypothetical protein
MTSFIPFFCPYIKPDHNTLWVPISTIEMHYIALSFIRALWARMVQAENDDWSLPIGH